MNDVNKRKMLLIAEQFLSKGEYDTFRPEEGEEPDNNGNYWRTTHTGLKYPIREGNSVSYAIQNAIEQHEKKTTAMQTTFRKSYPDYKKRIDTMERYYLATKALGEYKDNSRKRDSEFIKNLKNENMEAMLNFHSDGYYSPDAPNLNVMSAFLKSNENAYFNKIPMDKINPIFEYLKSEKQACDNVLAGKNSIVHSNVSLFIQLLPYYMSQYDFEDILKKGTTGGTRFARTRSKGANQIESIMGNISVLRTGRVPPSPVFAGKEPPKKKEIKNADPKKPVFEKGFNTHGGRIKITTRKSGKYLENMAKEWNRMPQELMDKVHCTELVIRGTKASNPHGVYYPHDGALHVSENISTGIAGNSIMRHELGHALFASLLPEKMAEWKKVVHEKEFNITAYSYKYRKSEKVKKRYRWNQKDKERLLKKDKEAIEYWRSEVIKNPDDESARESLKSFLLHAHHMVKGDYMYTRTWANETFAEALAMALRSDDPDEGILSEVDMETWKKIKPDFEKIAGSVLDMAKVAFKSRMMEIAYGWTD